MSEYTPTTEAIIFAYTENKYAAQGIDYGPAEESVAREEVMTWLSAHDAEVRAGVVAEEPEWEYGACYQGDNGRELLWFSMANGGFAIREAAEKEVDRYADAQIRLCRRRKAGSWEPVEN